MTDSDTPSWGIEQVPDRLRLLGVVDGLLLWANLSVSLLVIVAGAFLVLPPDQFGLGLSLPVALAAIVAAAIRTRETLVMRSSRTIVNTARVEKRPHAAKRSGTHAGGEGPNASSGDESRSD